MDTEGIVRKVRALQDRTVARGATEAEAAEALQAIARLEARLGRQVAPATEARPRLGLRGRIYRAQASAYQRDEAEALRRKAEALRHIIGL